MEEENDGRPLMQDLLQQHALKLAELRAILEKEDSYSKEHYDDIWMLRFLLTHKKIPKASTAAIHTMNFRQERKLNELGDIRHMLISYREKYMAFFKAETAIMYAQPDCDRGLVQIIFPAHYDMEKALKCLNHEETLDLCLMANETIYQILDEVTRRTGKLTKLLRIMDASDFEMTSFNREYAKRDSAVNKQLEDLYPQLLGTVVVANAASWVNKVWKLFKPLCPKRFTEKIAFVQPLKSATDVEYFLKYVSRNNLWERYGGESSDWPVAQPCHLWEK